MAENRVDWATLFDPDIPEALKSELVGYYRNSGELSDEDASGLRGWEMENRQQPTADTREVIHKLWEDRGNTKPIVTGDKYEKFVQNPLVQYVLKGVLAVDDKEKAKVLEKTGQYHSSFTKDGVTYVYDKNNVPHAINEPGYSIQDSVNIGTEAAQWIPVVGAVTKPVKAAKIASKPTNMLLNLAQNKSGDKAAGLLSKYGPKVWDASKNVGSEIAKRTASPFVAAGTYGAIDAGKQMASNKLGYREGYDPIRIAYSAGGAYGGRLIDNYGNLLSKVNKTKPIADKLFNRNLLQQFTPKNIAGAYGGRELGELWNANETDIPWR